MKKASYANIMSKGRKRSRKGGTGLADGASFAKKSKASSENLARRIVRSTPKIKGF